MGGNLPRQTGKRREISAGEDPQRQSLVASGAGPSRVAATYFILRDGVDYRDLGPEHFHRLTPEKRVRDLVRQLENLDKKVTLENVAA